VALGSFLQNMDNVCQLLEEPAAYTIIIAYMSALFCEKGQLNVAQSVSSFLQNRGEVI
jgi:hypothetical protein